MSVPRQCVDCLANALPGKDRCAKHWRLPYRGNWQTIRRQRLVEHPMCEMCGQAPSVEVHHVNPRNLDEGVEALCHDCHRQITR